MPGELIVRSGNKFFVIPDALSRALLDNRALRGSALLVQLV
jgi:hypothetical protein